MASNITRRAAASPNPADDPAFRRALLRHVDRLAATITHRDSGTHGPRADRSRSAPSGYAAVQYCERIAAAWVYMSCVAVWAEDHALVAPLLRRDPVHVARNRASSLLWLGRAFQQVAVHPATQWLLHPDYQPLLWAGAPSPDACADLIDWWAADAPSLFYPSVNGYPASITGWPIGDLLTVLSPQRRKQHALVQTPHFVADLILEETLVPAADTFRDEHQLRLIDPAAGTGHFLIRAVDYLWQWYTTGRISTRQVTGRAPVTGGTVYPPAQAIRRILAGVDGVDIDPLTAAVGRLRMTVYIGHLMAEAGLIAGPPRLATIPGNVTPRIAVGDALLLGTGITRAAYGQVHPHLADLPGAAFPRAGFDWPDHPDPAGNPPDGTDHAA
jgi:hypothetical protein